MAEFEIYSDEIRFPTILKLKTINNDMFIYKYFITPGENKVPLAIYQYPKASTNYIISIKDPDKSHASLENDSLVIKKGFARCLITVKANGQDRLFYIVEFVKLNAFDRFLYGISSSINYRCLLFINTFNRNKIVRLIKEGRVLSAMKRKLNI